MNFQLDGGNNTAGLRGTGNPAPNPEAVQEFRVITNNYAAEYGRYPAGVVDVVTKSGTNQFHGAAFEFFRDEQLNAKRWAPPGATSAQATRSIAINTARPAAGRSGRTDVLLRELLRPAPEETYYRNSAVVPTALERAGDFSASAIKPRDPLTTRRSPATSSRRTASIRRRWRSRTQYVPHANLPNNFFEVRRPGSAQHRREGRSKLDHALSATRSLALSYFYLRRAPTRSRCPAPATSPGSIATSAWTQHNLNADRHVDAELERCSISSAFTYVRQFGARVNNPTTSLGDLELEFKIQGDPTLPRLTCPATSPRRPRSPAPTPAATSSP